MKLLGISGSQRTVSSNTRLLEAACSLTPPGLELEIVTALGDLPHFNPDTLVEPGSKLDRFIDAIRVCDGIVVSSPVYAGGYPGTLKNALDWLVGTDAFIEKPFVMLSASNRVPAVQESLVTVLETMGGIHVHGASVLVPLLGSNLSTSEIASHGAFANLIRSSLIVYADYLNSKDHNVV